MSVFTDRPEYSKERLGQYWFAIDDSFPVTQGHTLLVPYREIVSIVELTQEEWAELQDAIDYMSERLRNRWNCSDFNIGINEGPAAGRTINHLHIHIIPRREGDMADPRGGVRHVIPDRGNYKRHASDLEKMAAWYQQTAHGRPNE